MIFLVTVCMWLRNMDKDTSNGEEN